MTRPEHKRGSIYLCAVCGAVARFGRNVSRHARGEWFCRKHWEALNGA